MPRASPLHRFNAAVQAFVSSRRALGRALQVDEYVLRNLRKYLARAGYCDPRWAELRSLAPAGSVTPPTTRKLTGR
jgi:hypothetical protein